MMFGWILLLSVFGASLVLHTANPHSVCRSCDPRAGSCRGQYCTSNCNDSKICPNPEDVCAGVWWRNDADDGVVTIETMCHNPTQPLYEVMLEDFRSSDCLLTSRFTAGRHLRVCACTGYVCNEHVLISKLPTTHQNTQDNKKSHRPRQLCLFCDIESTSCNNTGVCELSCNITSICESSNEVCVSSWKRRDGISVVESLCHDPALPFHGQYLQDYNSHICQMKPVRTSEDFYICSCNTEECNNKLIFTDDSTHEQKEKLLLILVPLVICLLLIVSFFYCCHVSHHLKSIELKTTVTDSETYTAIISNDKNPNHNTELLPIQLDVTVGKGRFSEVFRATLKQNRTGQPFQTVAVKVFPYGEYSSWKAEQEIFSNTDLQHENVLHFLKAEHRKAERQYWLITAYHERGNLQDFLSHHIVSWKELCRLGASLARGVAHLHSEQTASRRPKVPMVHRDLKSSNVLVKADLSCCLCDFGLSLRLDNCMTPEQLANSGQVGTVRYMAPEVLESRMNLENIESFKQADVYSMALILWEIMSRCSVIGDVREYKPPFGMFVEHPCVESMKDHVIRDRRRPEIPAACSNHTGVRVLSCTIKECWDHDPESRLTAHCVVERFDDIISSEQKSPIDSEEPIWIIP